MAARPTRKGSAKRMAKPSARRPLRRARPKPGPTKAGTHPKPARPSRATKPETGVKPSPPPGGAEPSRELRRHVLSLSFLRDGDEFLARLESDGGEITELKNRSLDQLLTLVANELEDLLE